MSYDVNYYLSHLFSVLLAPLFKAGDMYGVILLSILTGLIVLVFYKYFSKPDRIKDAKNTIKSGILGLRLYRDFFNETIYSLLRAIRGTVKYFIYNLVPVLIMLPFLMPVFTQMEKRYGARPFEVNEPVVVRAGLDRKMSQDIADLSIEGDFALLMKPVKIPGLNEVNWKLAFNTRGIHKVKIKYKNKLVYERTVAADRYKHGYTDYSGKESKADAWLFPPDEKRFDDTSVLRFVSVKYKGAETDFLLFRLHWIYIYLLLTVVIVFAFKKSFNVEF